jgi:hypothetical protein
VAAIQHGHVFDGTYVTSSDHRLMKEPDLPDDFDWGVLSLSEGWGGLS